MSRVRFPSPAPDAPPTMQPGFLRRYLVFAIRSPVSEPNAHAPYRPRNLRDELSRRPLFGFSRLNSLIGREPPSAAGSYAQCDYKFVSPGNLLHPLRCALGLM